MPRSSQKVSHHEIKWEKTAQEVLAIAQTSNRFLNKSQRNWLNRQFRQLASGELEQKGHDARIDYLIVNEHDLRASLARTPPPGIGNATPAPTASTTPAPTASTAPAVEVSTPEVSTPEVSTPEVSEHEESEPVLVVSKEIPVEPPLPLPAELIEQSGLVELGEQFEQAEPSDSAVTVESAESTVESSDSAVDSEPEVIIPAYVLPREDFTHRVADILQRGLQGMSLYPQDIDFIESLELAQAEGILPEDKVLGLGLVQNVRDEDYALSIESALSSTIQAMKAESEHVAFISGVRDNIDALETQIRYENEVNVKHIASQFFSDSPVVSSAHEVPSDVNLDHEQESEEGIEDSGSAVALTETPAETPEPAEPTEEPIEAPAPAPVAVTIESTSALDIDSSEYVSPQVSGIGFVEGEEGSEEYTSTPLAGISAIAEKVEFGSTPTPASGITIAVDESVSTAPQQIVSDSTTSIDTGEISAVETVIPTVEVADSFEPADEEPAQAQDAEPVQAQSYVELMTSLQEQARLAEFGTATVPTVNSSAPDTSSTPLSPFALSEGIEFESFEAPVASVGAGSVDTSSVAGTASVVIKPEDIPVVDDDEEDDISTGYLDDTSDVMKPAPVRINQATFSSSVVAPSVSIKKGNKKQGWLERILNR